MYSRCVSLLRLTDVSLVSTEVIRHFIICLLVAIYFPLTILNNVITLCSYYVGLIHCKENIPSNLICLISSRCIDLPYLGKHRYIRYEVYRSGRFWSHFSICTVIIEAIHIFKILYCCVVSHFPPFQLQC